MFAPLGQKTSQVARNFLPFLTTLFLVLLGVMVWPVPSLGDIAPTFGLAAIYYWAVYRPDLLRPSSVFVLGLLNDAVNDMPLGLSGLLFLGVYQLAVTYRRFFAGQHFLMLWLGFAVLSFCAALLSFAGLSLYKGVLLQPLAVTAQYVLTATLFPLLAWLLNRTQRFFLTQG
ncbi:MAG: rod shape-determining protein MreD [Alphaproteobacteria bacterium]|nr:rod shape-determining protein MreD [Alphaproteobacteria bacterium]